MQLNSARYIVIFAAIVCAICSLFVTGAAVLFKDRQTVNALHDKQMKVLLLAGLVGAGEKHSTSEAAELFRNNIVTEIVELSSGDYVTSEYPDAPSYDQKRALNDPDASAAVERNPAQVPRIPLHATVYRVVDESGATQQIILPVEGKGLWSTLYGFLSLDPDTTTIRGLTFYQHGETPGLGGEVDNPRWKEKWQDRQAFNKDWEPVIRVIKGAAGPPEQDPHLVDGLSGATITSNGVTYLLQFWLGDQGFGPYLARLREEGSKA